MVARTFINIDSEGQIRVNDRNCQRQLAQQPGPYRPLVIKGGIVLLGHEFAHGVDPHVLMAGTFHSQSMIIEIINSIATANWRGELNVISEEAHRALFFDQGVLRSAQSDQAEDRLGELLVRGGVLSKSELDSIVSDMPTEKRFGQVVVERGYLDHKQLFAHLQKQVEQTFYATMQMVDGHYYFLAHTDTDHLPAGMTVHISVQNLLMLGVQRIDEMTLFRERISSMDLCPEARRGASDKVDDVDSKRVLLLSDGQNSLNDLSQLLGLDEFDVTKTVYQLLQQGHLTLRAGPEAERTGIISLTARFNALMRDIFMAVATYGGIERTRQTISVWLEGSGYNTLFGSDVQIDGTVNIDHLLVALEQSQTERPLETAYQALHELAAFALFAATTSLPKEQDTALSRDINVRLKQIRLENF